MKIKYVDFYIYLFMFFLLVQSEFFYVIPLNNTLVKAILTTICVLLYFIFLLNQITGKQKVETFYVFYLLIIIPVFIIIQWVYTKGQYGQASLDFFKAAYHYIYLIWIVPLIYVFKRIGTVNALDKITNLVCFGQTIYIVNTIIYSMTNRNFLFITEMFRGDNLRTYAVAHMIIISIVFLSWKIFSLESRKRNDIIKWCISMSALYICFQSRYLEITSSLLIVFFLTYGKKFSRKQLRYIVLIELGLLIFIVGGYAEEFFDTFQIGGLYSGSTSSRLREIEYYYEAFRNNPFTGLGLLSTESSIGNYIIRGSLGRNYPTDVGYIGDLGNMGLTVLLPLCPFYFRWLYLKKKYKINGDKYRILCTG